MTICTMILWIVNVGWQFIIVFRDLKAKKKRVSRFRTAPLGTNLQALRQKRESSHLGSYLSQAIEEPMTKFSMQEYLSLPMGAQEKFEEFVSSRYALENLRFLQDVNSFLTYFDEKGGNWRKHKATYLYETYLKTGSVLEVNISHADRSKLKMCIDQLNPDSTNINETAALVDSFRRVEEELTTNVLTGFWMDYLYALRVKNRKQRRCSLTKVFCSVATSV